MPKKTKQVSPARGWAFTLNNWTPEEFSSIVQRFKQNGDKYFWGIGKEIGEDKGTPHLQGWCYCKTDHKWRPLPKYSVKRNGLECTRWKKFSKCMMANHNYCKKDGDYVTNYGQKEEVKEIKPSTTMLKHMAPKGHFGRKPLCKWSKLWYDACKEDIKWAGNKEQLVKWGIDVDKEYRELIKKLDNEGLVDWQ